MSLTGAWDWLARKFDETKIKRVPAGARDANRKPGQFAPKDIAPGGINTADSRVIAENQRLREGMTPAQLAEHMKTPAAARAGGVRSLINSTFTFLNPKSRWQMTRAQGTLAELKTKTWLEAQGYKVAHWSAQNIYSNVDLFAIKDKVGYLVEVKSVDSARSGSLAWRTNIGGARWMAESKKFLTEHPKGDPKRAELFQALTKDSLELKRRAMRAATRKFGVPVKPLTIGVSVNYDKRAADLYWIPGYHSYVSVSKSANKKVATVTYSNDDAVQSQRLVAKLIRERMNRAEKSADLQWLTHVFHIGLLEEYAGIEKALGIEVLNDSERKEVALATSMGRVSNQAPAGRARPGASRSPKQSQPAESHAKVQRNVGSQPGLRPSPVSATGQRGGVPAQVSSPQPPISGVLP